MSDVQSKVTAIIVDKLGVEASEVTTEASFIMEFEREFNISIPDDQAEKIGTVGQAVEYIQNNAG
jgi:acyl carrier protein